MIELETYLFQLLHRAFELVLLVRGDGLNDLLKDFLTLITLGGVIVLLRGSKNSLIVGKREGFGRHGEDVEESKGASTDNRVGGDKQQ